MEALLGVMSSTVQTSGSILDSPKKVDATIQPFLRKAYEIVSNPEYSDICSWGENDDTIIVKRVCTIYSLSSYKLIYLSTYISFFLSFITENR